MRKWLFGLMLAAAMLPAQLWALAQDITVYMDFTDGNVLTAANLNNSFQQMVDQNKEIRVYFPGTDSLKIKYVVVDSLKEKTVGQGIVVMSQLRSRSAADSLAFLRGRITRLKVDSLFIGEPFPAWSGGATAGIKLRFNYTSIDSAKIVDSLAVMPGAKVKFFRGSIVDAGKMRLDTLTTDSLTVPKGAKHAYVAAGRVDSLSADSLTVPKGSKPAFISKLRTDTLSVDSLGVTGSSTLDTLVVTGPATVDTITSTSIAILDTARIDSSRISKLTVLTSANFTGVAVTGLSLASLRPDSLWIGAKPVAPLFSGGGTAGVRWRFNLVDLDTLRIRDSTTVLPGAKVNFMAGSAVQAASIDVDTLAGAGAVVPDNYIFGLGSGKATVEFDDQSAGEVNILNATLSVGSSTPGTSAGQLYTSGSIFVNDNANTKQTLGLTINTGANDDRAIDLKSTDVAHGITSETETDSYAGIQKYDNTNGGLSILGYGAAADGVGMYLLEIHGTDNTTHTAAGKAGVWIIASKKSGTSNAAVGTDGNLFAVSNNASTRFIVDAEGDLFADGSAPTIYDDYDDVALLSTFDYHEARVSNQRILESEWEDYTKYHEQDLIEMGLIGGPRVGVDPSQRGLINYTGMVRLHNGAIRQVGRSVNELDHRTERLAEDMEYLKSRYRPDPTFDDVQAVLLKWMYSLFAGGN